MATNPIFNPADFVTSSSGLTELQANALYPRMNTESTSSALQTFTSGILTPSISSTLSLLELGSATSGINIVGELQLNGVSGSATDVLTSNGEGLPPTFQPAQVVSTFPDGLTTASVNPIDGNLMVGSTLAAPYYLSLGSSFAPTQVVGTLTAPTINSPAAGTSLIIGGEIVGPAKLYLGSVGQTVNARGGLLVAGSATVSGSTGLQALTATSVSTPALTSTGSTSVGAVTASGSIGAVGLTSSAGLTVSSGATSVLALTASGALSAASVSTPSLTVSAGTANVVALTASGALSAASVSTPSLTVSATANVVALTASGALSAASISTPSLTVSAGTANVVNLVASGSVNAVGLNSSLGINVSSGTTSLKGVNATSITTPSLTSTGNLVVSGAILSTIGNALTVSGALLANTTLGVSGTSTLAAVTASGVVAANAGLTSTSISASTTLGVTGTSTLGAVTASGVVAANAGLTATSLSASTTLGVTGVSTLTGGLKTDTIDTKSASGTLTLGSTDCIAITIAKPVTTVAHFSGGIQGGGTQLSIGTDSITTSNLVLGQTGKISYLYGNLNSNIDISTAPISCGSISAPASKLTVGGGTCTSVDISAVGKTTAILGDATIAQGLKTNSIDTVSGVLTIGGANCTGVTFSDTISGLSMGGSNNITLGSGAAISTVGQLGYKMTGSAFPAGAFATSGSISSITMTPGTWLFVWSVTGQSTTFPTSAYLYLSSAGVPSGITNPTLSSGMAPFTSNKHISTGSEIVYCTAAAYVLNLVLTGSYTAGINGFFQAVRIA